MTYYDDFEQSYQNTINDSTIEHLYNFLSLNPIILTLFIQYLSDNEDNNGSAGDIENFIKSITRLNSKVLLAKILETLQKLILSNQLDKKILNKLNKVFSDLGIDIYNLDLNKFINEFKEKINQNEKITKARKNIEEINKNNVKNINVTSNNLEIIKGIRKTAKLETEKLNKTTKNILKSSNKMLNNNKLNANKLFGILSSIKKTLGIGAIGGIAGGLKTSGIAGGLKASIMKEGVAKAGGIGSKIGNLKKGMEGAALKGNIGLGSGKGEAKLGSQLATKGKMEGKREEKIEKRESRLEKSQEVFGNTKSNSMNNHKEKPVENNRNTEINKNIANNNVDKSKNNSITGNNNHNLNDDLSKKQNNVGVGDNAKLLGSIIKDAFKEVNKEKPEKKSNEKIEEKSKEKLEEKSEEKSEETISEKFAKKYEKKQDKNPKNQRLEQLKKKQQEEQKSKQNEKTYLQKYEENKKSNSKVETIKKY